MSSRTISSPSSSLQGDNPTRSILRGGGLPRRWSRQRLRELPGVLLLGPLLVLMLFASPALGQRTEGLELFRRGTEQFNAGQYQRAITLFKESLALHPHPNTLYSIGESYRRLGRYRRSHQFYLEYARQLPPLERQKFQSKLDELRRRSSTLTVLTDPPGAVVRVDDEVFGSTPPAGPLRLTLKPGRSRVGLAMTGYRSALRELTAEFGEPLALDVTLEPDGGRAHAPRPEATLETGRGSAPQRVHLSSGVTLGLVAGLSLTSFGDPALEVSPSAHLGAELGHGWRRDSLGWGVRMGGQLMMIQDSVVDDQAAVVNITGGVSGRWLFARRLWLEARFSLGVSLLLGAASESFLIQRPGSSQRTLVGLTLQPALGLGVNLWRGLSVMITPLALSYGPRVGGFDELAPSISRMLSYAPQVGLSWSFGGSGD